MVQICKETYYFTHFILFVGYLQVLCYVTDLFKFCKNIKMKMFRPIIIHFIHFIFQHSFSICKGLHCKLLLWVPITVSTKLCQQKKNIINLYREAYDTQNYLIMELSDTGYMLLFECRLSCFYIAWVLSPKDSCTQCQEWWNHYRTGPRGERSGHCEHCPQKEFM